MFFNKIILCLLFVFSTSCAMQKKYSSDAGVRFITPKNGSTVTSPVKLRFGVSGMVIKPAGTLEENTGHHHVIISPQGLAKGKVIPTDEKHIHFGKGQTETELKLKPGEYSLTLQFADGAHRSYGPKMAETIRIKVK